MWFSELPIGLTQKPLTLVVSGFCVTISLMAYDDNAKRLAVKIIGTVESDLNYSAVNYNDPITVGIAQWYGTRAANVLCRMRDENRSAWYGVQSSIANQLATIDKNNSYWNGRYLTQAEGNSLTGVMSRNQEIQNRQLMDDLIPYEATAINYGFNPETHTQTVLYFFSMHHQSPASALEVVRTLTDESTLDDIHRATLAHPILGQYGNRYRTTYDLIKAGDVSGVEPTPPEVVEPDPIVTNGNTKYIEQRGDLLITHFSDGESIIAFPSGPGIWTPRKAKSFIPEPEPTPEQPPPPPENGGNGGWSHPLPGAALTSPYGPRSFDGFHWGTDLSTGMGSVGRPVLAPTKIRITVSTMGHPGDYHFGTAGNHVKGHTLDGKYTFSFMHLSSLRCAVGDIVESGQAVGVEGATGNVTGLHLHLEAYTGTHNNPGTPPYGNPIDPLPILRQHGVNI